MKLVGPGVDNTAACPPNCGPKYFDVNDTGLTFVLGGGLDVRIYKRIAVRVFQLDYNPVGFNRENYNWVDRENDHLNGIRFSTGIVF